MENEDKIEPDTSIEVERTGGRSHERAGIYLAALAALAVPSLVVVALFLPTLSPSGDGSLTAASASTENLDPDAVELDLVAVGPADEVASSDGLPVEVAGAGESRDRSSADETPSTTTTESEAERPASASSDVDAPAPTGSPATTATPAEAPSVDSPSAAPPTTGPADTTTTAPATSVPGAPAAASPTTSAPATSPPATSPPTTSPPTTSPPTTSSPATSSSEPEVEPASFAQRVDIGRIGETTLQFRFSTAIDTAYVATIRNGGTVVARRPGTARANTPVNELIQDLDPGTDYSVQVDLVGPPAAQSPSISFRTSGGEPEPVDTPVSLVSLRVTEVGSTRLELTYGSNICANGSFTIREQGGPIVGSNAGQASGCTTRHLAIPGFWTPPLKPNTTYTITIQVEAGGAGRGNGNVATETVTVTTGV